ncbi:hypothetical protein [Streptomyces cinereoruber]|uniref:hypothetical protein n=1 Tax=Streptomyces cinereoruber TaxID=67260 RepID=UPI0036442D66
MSGKQPEGTVVAVEPPAHAVARDAHWAAKMERLRRRKLLERTATFADDPVAKKAVADAALALAKARADADRRADAEEIPAEQREAWISGQPNVLAADSKLAEANAALEDATITLTFRALPRPVWEDLLQEHPPTEQGADQGHEYNVDTFPAALISASSTDGMTAGEAQELLDAWSDPDAKALFTAALLVNQTPRADLGKG